jgi:hypothetical protein
MKNLLLETVDYKVDTTSLGTWRRYLWPNGSYFAEFTSHRSLCGLPLLHYTQGICPETGRRKVARGIVAVGRLATGIVAIGQASLGVVALGQLALGVLFGLGQASTGLGAIGQLAIGVSWGVGQIATGATAIGQLGFGKYVLAQLGVGEYLWTTKRVDPEAVAHFKALWQQAGQMFG